MPGTYVLEHPSCLTSERRITVLSDTMHVWRRDKTHLPHIDDPEKNKSRVVSALNADAEFAVKHTFLFVLDGPCERAEEKDQPITLKPRERGREGARGRAAGVAARRSNGEAPRGGEYVPRGEASGDGRAPIAMGCLSPAGACSNFRAQIYPKRWVSSTRLGNGGSQPVTRLSGYLFFDPLPDEDTGCLSPC